MNRSALPHLASLAITALMLALAAGSAKSTTPGAAGSASASPAEIAKRKAVTDFVDKMGVVYTRIAALMQKPPPDSACSAQKMIAKAPPGKDDYGALPLDVIYGPYLARFASKDASAWKPNAGPWKWLTANIYTNFDKFPGVSYDYELSSVRERIQETLLPHRYMIVAWPNDESKNRMPVYNDKDESFTSGKFEGYALIADVVDGTIECQKRISFTNDAHVKFRSSGLFREHPEQAVLEDFQDRAQAALESVLPGEPIKFASSMGSVFK